MSTPAESLQRPGRAVPPGPGDGHSAAADHRPEIAEVIDLEDYRRSTPSRTTGRAGRASSATDAADRRPPSFVTHRV